ncbi:MAG: glycogen debranching N-terminal domain-containing protein [Microbacterium pygmaeum]
MSDVVSDEPRQPLLSDRVVVLRAPTQAWSGPEGDIGGRPIDGIYHGDVRHIRSVVVTVDGEHPEWISTAAHDASRITFGAVLRSLDDDTPDPKLRLLRTRLVEAGSVGETLSVQSGLPTAVDAVLSVRIEPDFSPLQEVKAGVRIARPAWETSVSEPGSAVVMDATRSFAISAPDAQVSASPDAVTLEWPVHLDPRGRMDLAWVAALQDASLVVRGADRPVPWAPITQRRPELEADPRLNRWLEVALGDLDALRMALPQHPDDEFFAAGAPWFLTLFGRDSLWAARLALPVDVGIAASTLRVLARMQGIRDVPATAEQPGKILHELRSAPLAMPGEGIVLPPVYYGTVDATALWVCLLADAVRWGMPEAEVRDLLPALRAALDWLVHHGDNDGDGFIDYLDRTGHGLANQGWKDSGDSIQWRSGELAEGPIALCEVQGYAYEAAIAGADLLERFGEPGAAALRTWAAQLKERFAAAYWVHTPEGSYPAIALDAHKRPVDSLTSNIGHLLGTGILEPDQERDVAALLIEPSMLTGFGVRTMSTGAAGYWPLSYHGGSVWTHDSAIVAHGMARAGLRDQARIVIDDLLAAAEGFAYRVPELHSGDPRSHTAVPTPYPAACRPQAWSAAAAVTAASVLLDLRPPD